MGQGELHCPYSAFSRKKNGYPKKRTGRFRNAWLLSLHLPLRTQNVSRGKLFEGPIYVVMIRLPVKIVITVNSELKNAHLNLLQSLLLSYTLAPSQWSDYQVAEKWLKQILILGEDIDMRWDQLSGSRTGPAK